MKALGEPAPSEVLPEHLPDDREALADLDGERLLLATTLNLP